MEEKLKKFKKFKLENLIWIKYKYLRRHIWFDLDYYTFCIDQLSNRNLEDNINLIDDDIKALKENLKNEEKRWEEKLVKEEKENNIEELKKIEIKTSDIFKSDISTLKLKKFELFKEVND